jgi:hypothetical protein
MRQAAGALDPRLCSSPTTSSILAQLAEAADIMADGTQDPTQLCTGTSIGLGFTAGLAKTPDTAVAAPPSTPDPCADARAIDAGG